MQKSLDQKLERILSDPECKDFILADAKDPDMGFGIAAPGAASIGPDGSPRYRSLANFRQQIRQIVEQGLVDIMLMSASTSELLTIDERLFADSHVTPAVRANDTTDIWLGMGPARYAKQPSLPFCTTTIPHIQFGKLNPAPAERPRANLALYSVTFTNDAARDRHSLEQYKQFRLEAESSGLRHFLEVFAPNVDHGLDADQIPRFINDSIVRALAGVTRSARPLFLKIPYFGPAAMQQLVAYDPALVVGILGGSSGTTHDAFHLLADAKQHGARVALFGRKINNAEDQLGFVRYLRAVADDQLSAADAVRAYHGHLQEHQIPPYRPLDDDLQLTQFS